jgi:hypothetical protein
LNNYFSVFLGGEGWPAIGFEFRALHLLGNTLRLGHTLSSIGCCAFAWGQPWIVIIRSPSPVYLGLQACTTMPSLVFEIGSC